MGALPIAVTLALLGRFTAPEPLVAGPALSADIAAGGKGRLGCTRLGVRLVAHDGERSVIVRLGAGAVWITVRAGLGPAEVFRGRLDPDDCKRIARQLAMRWPRTDRWPKLVRRFRKNPAGEGDTELRIAVGPHALRVRVSEEDVQDVGFVAVLRGELFRLVTEARGVRPTLEPAPEAEVAPGP